jgi:hypothetical protein
LKLRHVFCNKTEKETLTCFNSNNIEDTYFNFNLNLNESKYWLSLALGVSMNRHFSNFRACMRGKTEKHLRTVAPSPHLCNVVKGFVCRACFGAIRIITERKVGWDPRDVADVSKLWYSPGLFLLGFIIIIIW